MSPMLLTLSKKLSFTWQSWRLYLRPKKKKSNSFQSWYFEFVEDQTATRKNTFGNILWQNPTYDMI